MSINQNEAEDQAIMSIIFRSNHSLQISPCKECILHVPEFAKDECLPFCPAIIAYKRGRWDGTQKRCAIARDILHQMYLDHLNELQRLNGGERKFLRGILYDRSIKFGYESVEEMLSDFLAEQHSINDIAMICSCSYHSVYGAIRTLQVSVVCLNMHPTKKGGGQ